MTETQTHTQLPLLVNELLVSFFETKTTKTSINSQIIKHYWQITILHSFSTCKGLSLYFFLSFFLSFIPYKVKHPWIQTLRSKDESNSIFHLTWLPPPWVLSFSLSFFFRYFSLDFCNFLWIEKEKTNKIWFNQTTTLFSYLPICLNDDCLN